MILLILLFSLLCSLSHPQPQGGSQAVTLTDDGLPIRPGQRPCKHYMKFSWCLFKQDCWYSHPPNKDTTKRSSSKAGAAGRNPPLFESELEPGGSSCLVSKGATPPGGHTHNSPGCWEPEA
jgi:hypothetical protein